MTQFPLTCASLITANISCVRKLSWTLLVLRPLTSRSWTAKLGLRSQSPTVGSLVTTGGTVEAAAGPQPLHLSLQALNE